MPIVSAVDCDQAAEKAAEDDAIVLDCIAALHNSLMTPTRSLVWRRLADQREKGLWINQAIDRLVARKIITEVPPGAFSTKRLRLTDAEWAKRGMDPNGLPIGGHR